MLPLKISRGKEKNSNTWKNLWNILFHTRNSRGPKKNSEPQKITTHLGEIILPFCLTAHCCSELDNSSGQLEDSVYSPLVRILLVPFLQQYYRSFRSMGILSLSLFGYMHLGPIDSNISKKFTCKYCRMFANATFKVHLFSQSVQLLYSHHSYFKSCSYLLF